MPFPQPPAWLTGRYGGLTDVLFLLPLLFVLILKAWHWQINNLSSGFQMSQQGLSSYASAGSDVCNSIGARGESAMLASDPAAKACVLSSLAGCDAKLQEFWALPGEMGLLDAGAVLGALPERRSSQKKYVAWRMWEALFFNLLLSFPFASLSFRVEVRTCLWLGWVPQTRINSLSTQPL